MVFQKQTMKDTGEREKCGNGKDKFIHHQQMQKQMQNV